MAHSVQNFHILTKPFSQETNLITDGQIIQAAGRSINQSIKQATNQATNQPSNQATKQATKQPSNQPNSEPANNTTKQPNN